GVQQGDGKARTVPGTQGTSTQPGGDFNAGNTTTDDQDLGHFVCLGHTWAPDKDSVSVHAAGLDLEEACRHTANATDSKSATRRR
ncbi:MAG: hypothetical protein ABIN99_09960, partial [Nitrosospira sp.]